MMVINIIVIAHGARGGDERRRGDQGIRRRPEIGREFLQKLIAWDARCRCHAGHRTPGIDHCPVIFYCHAEIAGLPPGHDCRFEHTRTARPGDFTNACPAQLRCSTAQRISRCKCQEDRRRYHRVLIVGELRLAVHIVAIVQQRVRGGRRDEINFPERADHNITEIQEDRFSRRRSL